MSPIERYQNKPFSERFSRLHNQLLHQRESTGRQEAARQLADFALREHFDCLSAYRAIDTAYELLLPNSRDKNAGLALFSEIENYFTESAVMHKMLIPFEVDGKHDHKAALKEITRLVASINTNRAVLEKTPWFQRQHPSIPNTEDFFLATLKQAHRAITEGEKTVVHSVIQTLSNTRVYKVSGAPENILEASGIYRDVIEATKPLMMAQGSKPSVRHEILRIITDKNRKKSPVVADIYTHKFLDANGNEGISLETILNQKNPDKAGRMLLDLMSRVPAGDMAWQMILEGLFLIPSQGTELKEYNEPRHKHLAERVFRIQQWITHKILLPSVSTTPPYRDPGFDYLFAHALSRSEDIVVARMGRMIYTGSTESLKSLQTFQGHASLEDGLPQSPIASLVLEQMAKKSRLVIMDRIIHRFLQFRWGEIATDLAARLKHNTAIPRFDLFMQSLNEKVMHNYSEDIARELNSHLKDSLGTNFREKLREVGKGADLAEINSDIWASIQSPRTEKDTVYFWPHPDVAHTIQFSEKSLAGIMGFQTLTFVVGDDLDKSVDFHLYSEKGHFGISGQFQPDGTTSWEMDTHLVDPTFLDLVTFVFLANFKSRLTVGEIIYREKSKKHGKKERHTNITNDEQEPHVQPLQRKRVIYTDTDGPTQMDSEDVRRKIKKKLKKEGFVFRTVGRHPMSLSGTDQFQEAYRLWQYAPQDAKDAAYQDLLQARKAMRQPNPTKVKPENLPQAFHLPPLTDDAGQQILDIKPGKTLGQPLWRKTWVEEFSTPRLSEAEKASIAVRYKRFYRGPAVVDLEKEIMGWFIEDINTPS